MFFSGVINGLRVIEIEKKIASRQGAQTHRLPNASVGCIMGRSPDKVKREIGFEGCLRAGVIRVAKEIKFWY